MSAGGVGPVLESSELGLAVVAAIQSLNLAVQVQESGSVRARAFAWSLRGHAAGHRAAAGAARATAGRFGAGDAFVQRPAAHRRRAGGPREAKT